MNQKSLNTTLRAYADVVRGQQDAGKEHEPTPTEYFAVISATIGQASSSQQPQFLIDSLRILEAVSTEAAQAVVRGQFRALSGVYLQIITMGTDNASLLKSVLSALGTLLYVQETADGFWNSVQALQCVNTLLAFLEDANMKLRKVASDHVIRLLTLHKKNGSKALRNYISAFCSGVLASCTRADYKRSLYIVLFLESAMVYLPNEASSCLALLHTVMGTHHCQQPVLTAATMRMVDAWFQSQQFSLREEETVGGLSLVAAGPLHTSDMESNTYHCLSLGSATVRLHRQITSGTGIATGASKGAKSDPHTLARLFSNVCAVLVHNCESDFVQVHDAVGTTLKRVAGECMDPTTVQEALAYCLEKQQRGGGRKRKTGTEVAASSFAGQEIPHPIVIQIVDTLQTLLQQRYSKSWSHVIATARTLMERLRSAGAAIGVKLGMSGQDVCSVICSSLVSRIVVLYESVESGEVKVPAATHTDIGDFMSTVVKCIGFSNFITAVPFSHPESPSYVGIDEKREWILHVLHASLRLAPASLCDFAVCVLSTISTCQDAIANPSRDNMTSGQVQRTKTRVLQLWSLFPDFCYYAPTDVPQFFPRLLSELEGALKNGNNGLEGSKEIVAQVLSGLTNLAQGAMGRACSSAPVAEMEGQLAKVNIYNRGSIAQTPEYVTLNAQATTILPAILTYLEGCEPTDYTFAMTVRCVNAWSGIAPPNLVTAVAKKLLQLLLQSTTASAGAGVVDQEQEAAASGWMSILLAVVPFLPQQMVHILYKTVKPMLSVHESVSSQKRAYSILDSVLEIHGDALYEKEPSSDILRVVCDSLMSCHVSARNMRLRCMESLVKNMAGIRDDEDLDDSDSDSDGDDDDDDDSISSDNIDKMQTSSSAAVKHGALSEDQYRILISAVDTIFSEVLLCQKDSNQKTRVQAKALIDVFVKRLTFHDIMSRLIAASTSNKKAMRASSLLTICMVLLQHKAGSNYSAVQETAMSLVPKVCMMLGEESAELSRAVLTFLRVCVSILHEETLKNILARITAAFCTGLGPHKSRFITRSRGIMRKLLNRLGEAALRQYIPPDDIALLDYLVKQNRRHDRKEEAKATGRNKRRSRSLEDVLMDSDDENDDDNDGNLMDITTAAPSRTKAKGVTGTGNQGNQHDDYRITARPKGIRASDDNTAHPNGLLEDQVDGDNSVPLPPLPQAQEKRNRNKRKRSDSFDNNDDGDDEEGPTATAPAAAKDKREADIYDPDEKYRVKVGSDGMICVEENSDPAEALKSKKEATKKTILASAKTATEAGQNSSNKRRKTKEPGEEYRAKKAGGDVWKKGMLEPHAYIPLDGRLLSKRNQREAVDKFAGVVKNNRAAVRTPSHVVKGNRNQRVARRIKNAGSSSSNSSSSNKRHKK